MVGYVATNPGVVVNAADKPFNEQAQSVFTGGLSTLAGAGVGKLAASVGGIPLGMAGRTANQGTQVVELAFDKASRTWTTPAGLDYGPGAVHGNRVKHVLDHAAPNPNKTSHSVLNVDRKQVLGLVDEAWQARGQPMLNDPGAYLSRWVAQ